MVRGRRQDHYGRRAAREGHAARAIYKLQEIDERWRLLAPGQRILDLGCAPGSWMQYAAKRVGSQGRVVGYDLQPVGVSLPPHAEAVAGDVGELKQGDFEAPFDIVLSDMAPQTMGDHRTDAARSAALAEMALQLAKSVLVQNGHVVVKVLEGGDLPGIVTGMKRDYNKVERLRPKATRRSSTEIFLIGLRRNRSAGRKP